MYNSSIEKNEAWVEPVKKISSEFWYNNYLEKLPNLTEKIHYLIYDNHKVTIFHLLNWIWPPLPKLYGKMKQKLGILFSC